jgi:hypothetical protein
MPGPRSAPCSRTYTPISHPQTFALPGASFRDIADEADCHEDRSFLGATVATARGPQIAELREYAVTADLYTWEGGWT